MLYYDVLITHHNKMKRANLIKKRNRIYRRLPISREVIRGTMVLVKRSCGHKNCRCQKGFKHASWYLSQSKGGKTRMTYLPKKSVKKAREYTERYREIKALLNELSEINLMLIIGG